MNRPPRRVPGALASVLVGLAIPVSGCSSDKPTAPAPDNAVPLTISAADRALLQSAVAFSREHAMVALERRDLSDRVSAAFRVVAERLEGNDRASFDAAIAAARAAIAAYRELLGADGAGAVELDAMMLTLDHATELASGAAARGARTAQPETSADGGRK